MAADQMTLLLGEADRDAGMAAALEHASADWIQRARTALAVLASHGLPFTADDLTAVVGLPPEGSSPNAVGAVINGAARQGLIRRVGEAQAKRRARHAGRVSLWTGAL